MKKLTYLFLVLALTISCEEDIDDNTPAFQSVIDGEFFGADEQSVQPGANDTWVITGLRTIEQISLQIDDLGTGVYFLGQNLVNTATYSVQGGATFTTGEAGGEVGKVTISEYNAEKGYVSGVFEFNAFNATDGTVNIQEGIFYRVRVQNIVPDTTP